MGAWAAAVALALVGRASRRQSVRRRERVLLRARRGRPAAAVRRVLVLDDLRHSYVDLADPRHLEFRYTRLVADVLATLPRRGPVAALHVGGGGFSLPRYLAAVRPGSTSTVLEVDPEVVGLARRRLGLRTGPALRVRTGDARVSLRDEPSGRYDVVIGDAFGGRAVPWHLTTREFLADVRRVLRPGGTYVVNVIDEGPLAFARAEGRTLQRAFRHVAALVKRGDGGGNVILVASDRSLPLAAMRARREDRDATELALSGPALDRFTGDARELTDAFAPVDQLLTPSG